MQRPERQRNQKKILQKCNALLSVSAFLSPFVTENRAFPCLVSGRKFHKKNGYTEKNTEPSATRTGGVGGWKDPLFLIYRTPVLCCKTIAPVLPALSRCQPLQLCIISECRPTGPLLCNASLAHGKALSCPSMALHDNFIVLPLSLCYTVHTESQST